MHREEGLKQPFKQALPASDDPSREGHPRQQGVVTAECSDARPFQFGDD
jgi:hypothetical protein